MKIRINKLRVKKDKRGWLVEILHESNLDKREFGQIFVTIAYPGIVKGGHYHKRKKEWFYVVTGEGELIVVDNKTGEEKKILMGENNMVAVEIPPNVTHWIKNIGEEIMHLLVYADEEFNPQRPDTYYLGK